VTDAVSTEDFNDFAGLLDYPMFVVTTTDGTELSGCLVGFTTQTSIDPPRFLVCLSQQNHTHGVARGADLLAVHVLDDDQHDLAELFGGETGDRTDKFSRCEWTAGPGGVPVLADCPAYVVGRVLEQLPVGDHTGFLLEPVEVEVDRDGDPLTLEDAQDVEAGHGA
jgi:flavin reductase (DIM6/NTAB) family NADH-FMN oxidoreductase RutF